jgi:hypothetical protein
MYHIEINPNPLLALLADKNIILEEIKNNDLMFSMCNVRLQLPPHIPLRSCLFIIINLSIRPAEYLLIEG